MKISIAKISLIILLISISACNSVKRVPNQEHLLTDNYIYVNDKLIKNQKAYAEIYQQPNVELPFVGIPLRLHIYNLAKVKPDSAFYKWIHKKPKRKERLVNFLSEKQVGNLAEGYINFNNFLKNTGQAPTIVNEELTKKSEERLKAWFWNHGWFNVEAKHEITKKDNKRASVTYRITPNKPYILDSLSTSISAKDADSLYLNIKDESPIKSGEKFNTTNFKDERERITAYFRNNGLYHFDQEYITFYADTIATDHKVNIDMVIANREEKKEDSAYKVPFKVHKISEVNVFTDYKGNTNHIVTDSTHYGGYTFFSFEKLAYNPKALSDLIFIKKGNTFSDKDRALTYSRINGLRVFNYPNIQYIQDPRDSTNTQLITNIFLTPKPKFGVDFNFDLSRSNIQNFGIGFGGSLLIRNIFGGAEVFEIAARGSVGSSKEAADSQDKFFNISEVGIDASLSFPKIAFPLNTDNIIPKYMYPFTTLKTGISTQKNIGLDKHNITGEFTYKWNPDKERTYRLKLIDAQYVRNLNTSNYFNVYTNSYNRLNEIAGNNITQIDQNYFNSKGNLSIPDGTAAFLSDYKQNQYTLENTETEEIRDIIERQDRLTENNFILATSFNYLKNTQENIYDKEFTQFRFKIEGAGNLLNLASPLLNLSKENDSYSIFNVQYSQYIKGEFDLIKHWDFGNKNILATRIFTGIAIPLGNANSIPFARSFFAGGANDNRGWKPYNIGPGSSGGRNEFNEANLKISLNAEYRFNLFGSLDSAIFIDAGNIWNVLDNVEHKPSRFESVKDLTEIAVSSGFGLRYDFSFFVIRLDLGFKTYDPAYNDQKWFTKYNFKNSVINFGINYPF
ncbi:MAG: BamA/TamA family outer membrane protein [Mesonia hippocampi]|uniref:translocation and assembly module lipoprotein TamL n=1 Tax=Mesonia hippocampi TaxID=1628250 RepID=UPI003F9A5701